MPLIKDIESFAGGILLIVIGTFLLLGAWGLVDQRWFLYVLSAFCLFTIFVGGGGIRLSMREPEKERLPLLSGDVEWLKIDGEGTDPNPLSKKEVK